MKFAGYATTQCVDKKNQVLMPGAMKPTATVKLLSHHDHDKVIGKVTHFEQREKGLFVRGEIDESTEDGAEYAKAARDGQRVGLSPGFKVQDADIDENMHGDMLIVLSADMNELSVTMWPVNPQALLEIDQ